MSITKEAQERYARVRKAAGPRFDEVSEDAANDPEVVWAEEAHTRVHPHVCHGCKLGAAAVHAFLDAVEERLPQATPVERKAPEVAAAVEEQAQQKAARKELAEREEMDRRRRQRDSEGSSLQHWDPIDQRWKPNHW